MNFSTQKKHNKKRGFTLIEMLIAVLIFSLSLTALMKMSSQGLKVAREAEKSVIADYLAVEAVELIRNLRDTALLRRNTINTWDAIFFGGQEFLEDDGCFTTLSDSANGSCKLVMGGGQPYLTPCSGNSCRMYLNAANGFYFQNADSSVPNGAIDSGFERRITVKEVTDGQVLVFVRVDWPKGSVVYTENLFLWQ